MKKLLAGIIDISIHNTLSIKRALECLGFDVTIINEQRNVEKFDLIVLPGVGAYHEAMKKLTDTKLLLTIEQALNKNKNFLGICLGMQLLFSNSSEGGINNGLGLIDGEVRRIKSGYQKIPHIGFDKVNFPSGSKMFAGIEKLDFYFVHSFCVKNYDNASLISHCIYNESFIAAIEKQHIWGTQFHPEKSQKNGLELLRNFLLAHGN